MLLLFPAACKSDSCVHGECVETINSHNCSCFDGFHGKKCENGETLVLVYSVHYLNHSQAR